PAVFSAANEVAVAAFLDEEIAFTDITRIVASSLDRFTVGDDLDLEAILKADAQARDFARQEIDRR
ncbi:MAG: 1-deoxy-D-xylulose-5-phosphate reductoisomerase, partial [Candidatus Electrothrix sp. AR4]|nr:1-deoxy-D-xylulose-5-phosphate reductoisomerase [Candidatus Electrothrix sp. AR4]